MGSSNVLSEKDANNSLKNLAGTGATKGEIKSMEYHRQVFQSKMEEEKYGHAASTANTTTTTTTTTIICIPTTAVGTPAGSGTTTVVATAAAAKPSLASSSKMIIHRTRAGRPADPNASGTRSSTHQYISPSDNIMSPCTAKLNAFKSRQAGKAKPKSLFAQASAKKFVGDNVFGARNAEPATSSKSSSDNDNQQQSK
ncbi:Spo12 family-domain-containing protein [Nemania serpens]|nr:Spo12 family-domain-containing protein [Nemania serpens]